MAQLKNLSYKIGGRVLFSDVNININPGKKFALIGPNGTGKTTLIKIIAGILDDYEGTILKPKQFRIGYLPQEEVSVTDNTVLESVLNGKSELKSIRNRLSEIHNQWTQNRDDFPELQKEAEQLEQKFQSLEGYSIENRSEKILSGLGFSKKDTKRQLSEFSGGWKMRAYFARILIQDPDLLLLDEPTNHLDLPSLEWVEKFLRFYKGSVLVVTHDRFFINRIADGIYEMEKTKVKFYSGDYHSYETEKEKNEELSIKKWKEYIRAKEKLERFISRFRYKASKAPQAQEKIKQLGKLKKVEPEISGSHIDFKIGIDKKSFNDVLTIKDLNFKYDKDWVLRNINLEIFRGEKIALVGKNGSGKTTLTKLIMGQLEPQMGDTILGENVILGYYAQHQIDNLDLNSTLFDETASATSKDRFPRIRDVLGIFGFSGEDINKPVQVLSGGEKARLSLAKILISSANFLIMDEPLNHLDKTAKETLEKTLIDYEGTLILISHDRYFLDKIVERVIEIKDGKCEEYHGNYSYYLGKRDGFDNSREIKTINGDSETTRKERKKIEAEKRQSISAERNRLKEEIEEYEKRIDLLEEKKKKIEVTMADPKTYEDKSLIVRLQKDLSDINKKLPVLYDSWEKGQISLKELLDQVTNKD